MKICGLFVENIRSFDIKLKRQVFIYFRVVYIPITEITRAIDVLTTRNFSWFSFPATFTRFGVGQINQVTTTLMLVVNTHIKYKSAMLEQPYLFWSIFLFRITPDEALIKISPISYRLYKLETWASSLKSLTDIMIFFPRIIGVKRRSHSL